MPSLGTGGWAAVLCLLLIVCLIASATADLCNPSGQHPSSEQHCSSGDLAGIDENDEVAFVQITQNVTKGSDRRHPTAKAASRAKQVNKSVAVRPTEKAPTIAEPAEPTKSNTTEPKEVDIAFSIRKAVSSRSTTGNPDSSSKQLNLLPQ